MCAPKVNIANKNLEEKKSKPARVTLKGGLSTSAENFRFGVPMGYEASPLVNRDAGLLVFPEARVICWSVSRE